MIFTQKVYPHFAAEARERDCHCVTFVVLGTGGVYAPTKRNTNKVSTADVRPSLERSA